jgi:hypothetical protein
VDERSLYKILTENTHSFKLSDRHIAEPDPTVEGEVTKIFTQARRHRNVLVYFYIIYTILFTVFVLAMIAIQAVVRVKWHDPHFELVPQWALNLLVTGMFAQFVGLLTIVTKQVWDFKPFFAYHNKIKTASGKTDGKA